MCVGVLAASVVGLVAFLVEPPGWSGWLVVASMAAAGLFVAFQMARGLFGPDIAAMKAAMKVARAPAMKAMKAMKRRR